MQMGATIRGGDRLTRVIKRTRSAQQKATETAIRIEAFAQKKSLQTEIRQRAPGGKRLAPLSFLAQKMKSPAARRALPAARPRKRGSKSTFANAVRYEVKKSPRFSASIGFVEGSGKSWKYFADIQQKGFIRPVSKAMRRMFATVGAKLGTIEGGDTPFFLGEGKSHMRTPARPIIAPFRQRHRTEIVRNIARHYDAKMAGRRV